MKSKVSDKLLESSSSESLSEDDENAEMLTEDVEKEFYKTLNKIKNKDPTIYKKDVEFFKMPIKDVNEKKKQKQIPLTLRDYERKLILEKKGELSDEETIQTVCRKDDKIDFEDEENVKNLFKLSEDEDDDDDDGLFKIKKNAVQKKEKKEKDYKDWLKGEEESASDEEIEKNLKALRESWTNPNLDEREQFLRDYLLNRRFVENDETDEVGEDAEDDKQDQNTDGKEDIGYSHRFEEPDQEFVKRYPRVMVNSLRRKNDHRKQKRDEVKERKLKEKEKKMAEVRRKKKLKKIEIEAKIEELKQLTGNDKLAFENILNQDFDLDEHDKAMKKLFSDEFYAQDDPNFQPDKTAEKYEEDTWNEEDYSNADVVADNEEGNCEDPNFNMDCDYDPTLEEPKPKESRSRRRKDKHRRTIISEAINREKPAYDPEVHQSFKNYLDQYYAMDCEDFIGDMPCRFKYRRTVPNSYGLTIEEILKADEKELERWCSIKRIHQIKPEYKEKCDLKVFQKKAADERLKRKILPSLYKDEKDQDEPDMNKKKRRFNKEAMPDDGSLVTNKIKPISVNNQNYSNVKSQNEQKNNKDTREISSKFKNENSETKKIKKRKFEGETVLNNSKKRRNGTNKNDSFQKSKNHQKQVNKPIKELHLEGMSDARLLAYGIKPKKFRNKLKYKKK